MASINNAAFPSLDGAALPTDLGQAMAEQLSRLFRRRTAALPEQGLAGPNFEELAPELMHETTRA